MNNEGKFKKTLNDLIQSKEFEFSESDWQNASAMIDDHRRGKGRRTPVLWLSSLVLGVAILGGLWLNNAGNVSVLKENSGATPLLAEKKIQTQQTTSTTLEAISSELKNESSTTVKEPKPANNFKLQTAKESPALAEQVTTPIPPNQPAIVSDATPNSTSKLTKAHITPNDSESTRNEKKNDQTSSLQNLVLNDVAAKDPGLTVNPASPETTAPEKSSSRIGPKEERTEEPTSNLKNTDDSSNNASSSSQKDTSTTPVLPEAFAQPAVAATGTLLSSEPIKGVGIYPTLPAADSAMLANESAVTFDAKEKPLILSIEAGVSYLYGWKNPGKTDANGYNPFVGVNYFQAIVDKLSVSLGIQYTSVGQLSYSSHVTKISSLGLGEDAKVTVFTPTKLHYLVAPLRFHYRLSPQNVVGIGCNMAYLLTAETDVETYNQNISGTDSHSLYKDKGYTQGFRQFDLQLSGFYRRRLTSNLSFNAELFYGLTDVKENAFFHSNVFERNSGLRISLVYNIQKR